MVHSRPPRDIEPRHRGAHRPVKPDYSSLDLPPPPADRPYVLINMVLSADGAVTIEGTERGLGSNVDHELMGELRVNADVVLNGASTLRASGTSSRVRDATLERMRTERDRSPNPIAAVLSRSGELPLDRAFFTADDFEAIVYLSETTPAERRDAVAATGRRVVVLEAGDEVTAMLRHMRHDLGARVLLVEGGPTMNGELLERRRVDEYFITLGPVIVGGAEARTAVRGPLPPTLDSVTRLELVAAVTNPETSELYLRYRVAGRGAVER